MYAKLTLKQYVDRVQSKIQLVSTGQRAINWNQIVHSGIWQCDTERTQLGEIISHRMTSRIEFEEIIVTDPITKKSRDAIAVIRNGHQVALLPEADRLRRALNLKLEEIEYIVINFARLMNREPTLDEREFWRAVLDFKRNQAKSN